MKNAENKNIKPIVFIREVAGKKQLYILLLMLVQIAIGISSVFYALFLRNVIDAAVDHNKSGMITAIAMFIGLVLFQIMLRAIIRFLEEYSKSGYENAFKSRLFKELLKRDYGEVTNTHSAEWMNRLTSDTTVVADGLTTIVPGVGGMLARLIGALIMLLIIEPRFAYVLIPGGFLLVVLTYAFRKQLKKLHKNMQEKDGQVRISLQEYLSSLMVVKAFSKENIASNYAEEKMINHRKARMQRNHFSNICNIGFAIVMNGAYVAGAVYGAYGIYNSTLTYGTFMAILQLVSQVQNPFANITGYLPKYYSMIASAERLMEVESYQIDSAEIRKIEFTEFGLKNASFSYIGEENLQVISDFNMVINKGEFVAFTGASGCGKSTILKILMSLYKLDGGNAYVNERQTDNNTVSQELTPATRSMFSYVPQGNQLMSGKIRDIVAFADEKRAADEEAVYKALRLSLAEDFVKELPEGIDTELGERGSGLSEGQMQRIAIARAVFSERPVLLLDEATSALDEMTERKLLENIRSMTDKTVIIVTHRPEALKVCDRQIQFGIDTN